VINAGQDMPKSVTDELQGGVVPRRIERHGVRVADERECAFSTIGANNLKDAGGADTEARKRRMQHHVGAAGRQIILERYIKQQLLPLHSLCLQRRTRETRTRVVEAREAAVVGERDARCCDAWRGQRVPVSVNRDALCDPDRGRVRQQRPHTYEIKRAVVVQWKIHITHRVQRNANEETEHTGVALHKGSHRHALRDFVC
jgi:hypothetical protein